VAALAAALAPAASAHVMTRAQMRAGATTAAASIKRDTGAATARVLKCRRSSDHRGRCGVETRYASGAGRCVTKVGIRLVGSSTRWRAGETTCY
jgi:hypothetical protein